MILLDLLKVLKGDISVYSAEGKLLIRSENNKISIAELIDWGNAYVYSCSIIDKDRFEIKLCR